MAATRGKAHDGPRPGPRRRQPLSSPVAAPLREEEEE